MHAENTSPSWLDRPLIKGLPQVNIQSLLVAIIILVALVSHFAILGERVMSHDEVNHVWPSYDYFKGKGYQHNPVTHGPFQFHVVALSYFLFGDSDFTSRIPSAVLSTAAIVFVLFAFRRYLGRVGALIAGLLFTISPYLLFYGRYTRNESFIMLYMVVMIWAVLRHMEKGDNLSIYLFTASIVMHFCSKETSFIYMALMLLFLALIFLLEVRRAWRTSPARFNRFVLLVVLALALILGAIAFGALSAKPAAVATPAANQPPGVAETAVAAAEGLSSGARVAVELGVVVVALALFVLAFYPLIKDLGLAQLRKFRSFALLIIAGTFTLPQLSALPVKMLGWDPLDYSSSVGLLRTGGSLVVFLAISVVVGIWWNRSLWLKNAALFYGIYIFFYTSMFTNGAGFFSGIIGSLGYWLGQQGEQRGTQPLYYFALIQVPFYEFLGLIGTFLAAYFGFKHDRFSHLPGTNPSDPQPGDRDREVGETSEADPAEPSDAPYFHELAESAEAGEGPATSEAMTEPVATDLSTFYDIPQRLPVLGLLLYWSVMSMIAYTLAGERMPWLTVHIALPLLLSAGWGLGYLVDTTDWKKVANLKGAIALLLAPVFLIALSNLLGSLLGVPGPFKGNELENLQATSRFLFSLLATVASAAGVIYLLIGWPARQITRLVTLAFFAILTVLTARSAYIANFIHYDDAVEFLVYAHAARGPKDILAQVEEISRRTTRGKDIEVAYSADAQYPYWWYFRDYPNARWFGSDPTRELRDAPIILAGADVFSKIEPVVRDNFVMFEYIRLWWPMEDYKNLTWERIKNALGSPEYRQALWEIWLNRDYSRYASLTGSTTLTLENWQPSERIRMYVRKDIVSQIWEYGVQPPTTSEPEADPYEAGMIELLPDRTPIGSQGSGTGLLQSPRGIATAPDGSIYVTDSMNHRIQHFSADGQFINAWGSFADISQGDAPGGTFYEPWDVAVAQDGTVFVSDTWNHRIQSFTADGQFIRAWGYFGQAETPDAFWGPRGLAIDQQGRLYVADTGNKRIAVFDPDGAFVTQFGSAGMDLGQFDEPTGVAIGSDGTVYVADTWNQRVQAFTPSVDGLSFIPGLQWEIQGWYGTSLENKPYLKVSPVTGEVVVADPEGYRVLVFSPQGDFLMGWGDYSTGMDGFGLVSGLAFDDEGGLWVSDGGNNTLLHFTMP